MDKIVVSKAFDWKSEDTKRVIKNALKFLVPLVLMYTGVVIGRITNAGGELSASVFTVNSFMAGGMTLYVLNAANDAMIKFLGSEKYIVKK